MWPVKAGAGAARFYVLAGYHYSEYTQDPPEFQDEGAPICFHAMIRKMLETV